MEWTALGQVYTTLGRDVAAGVGKDSSVAEVFCLETDEQVGRIQKPHDRADISPPSWLI